MIIQLYVNKTAVDISPDAGASILKFSHDGQDMMRSTNDRDNSSKSALQTACFPLVPYSNRIRDGRFTFEGEEIDLSSANAAFKHALHGTGWLNSWRVKMRSETVCQCDYRPTTNVWPWAYRAEQLFELSDQKLCVKLSITNESDRNMPCGLGLHPYFPNVSKASLQFDMDGVWIGDEDVLPRNWAAAPPNWDFNTQRTLLGADIDNCFTGFNSQAQIQWKDKRFGLKIKTDKSVQFAVVYVPPNEDYFCFEPVTHMNDAANWSKSLEGTGWQSLAPGETFTTNYIFQVTEP